MPNWLLGRSGLVTGGTRGIGSAIAKRLLEEGATVAITGTRSDRPNSSGMRYYPVDFGNLDQTEAFARQMSNCELDILINNAGINKIAPFSELDPADYDRIQQVNVRAPFRLCQAVVPAMRRKKWGRIINITSIFGVISKEFRAPYSASKFALDGLTAALAAEVAADGVLANCVSPGFIDTELTRRVLGEAGIRELISHVPIRRLGRPEEIASLVAWLASPENTFISGQNIVIDGGFTRV